MGDSDKTIICRDCGKPFTFTAGAQAFYAEKGFTCAPTRCPPCRTARQAAGPARAEARRAGGPQEIASRPAGPPPARPRPAGPREVHTATCAVCGQRCEVPFAPRSGKPIYCPRCFRGHRDRDARR